jgi:hypothetical protein
MDASIITYNGALTLSVNGELYPCTAFKPTELRDEQLFAATVARTVAEMAARGVHVFFVPVYFTWTGPGAYDFTPIDRRITQVLAADPSACIVIRIQAAAFAPHWWMDAHPEDVVQFGCGRVPEPPKAMYQTGRCPSLASDFWETAGVPAATALAQHVHRQPYAPHIIGYLPTAYNSNEWFLRSYDDLQVNDFCPVMQQAFARYLGRDGEALLVPDRIARGTADCGIFFHPENPVVAYYRFINELMADKILKVTAALRAAHAPDHIIVGAFYGYSLGLANFYWLPDSGHLAQERLLGDDGPDFTCSPLDYFSRNIHDQPGGGFCWAQGTAPDSLRLVGKGYWGEDDLIPTSCDDYMRSEGADPHQDAELLKRNFAFTLCKGQLQWWYDLHGHWYEGQERLNTIADCRRIAQEALQHDRSPVSQIAVVMDERASWYLTLDRQLQRALFYENFFHTFSGIGAPVDLLTMRDLTRVPVDRYRIVFFPTAFALTAEERRCIDRLKADGRMLVFYQAPGYIHPGEEQQFSMEAVRDVTGMHIADTQMLFQMRVTTGTGHPLLDGVEDVTFGLHTEKPLCFYLADPQVQALGAFGGNGPIALGLKRFPEWTSVYCGVPGMPSRLARNLVRDAGVPLYLHESADIVYANASYVGVFTVSAGRKQVTLPAPSRVWDCFTGQRMHDESVDSITWDAEQYHAYLFRLER